MNRQYTSDESPLIETNVDDNDCVDDLSNFLEISILSIKFSFIKIDDLKTFERLYIKNRLALYLIQ